MNANAKAVATYAAAGMNDRQIARSLGISTHYVFDIRRQYGILSAHMQNAERIKRDVLWMHHHGLTDQEIALTTGDHPATIKSARNKLGLEANKRLVPKGAPPSVQKARKLASARAFAERHRERLKAKRDAKKAVKPKVQKAKAASKPKPKPRPRREVRPPQKPPLIDQVRPIRAALGGVFEREPAADVQGVIAVAMRRMHSDQDFARAWMEAGR